MCRQIVLRILHLVVTDSLDNLCLTRDESEQSCWLHVLLALLV